MISIYKSYLYGREPNVIKKVKNMCCHIISITFIDEQLHGKFQKYCFVFISNRHGVKHPIRYF